jgi:Leucine-rich repeat (LRR) protein
MFSVKCESELLIQQGNNIFYEMWEMILFYEVARWTLAYVSAKTNCNPCDLFVEVVTFNFLLSAMASREEKKREIEALLEDQHVETIFLTGEAGVGKTWIAEEMSDFASSNGLSYMTFWVFLNQRSESMSFYSGSSLYENFARQLSLLSDFEDWEEDNVSKEEKPEEKRLDMESLKGEISKVLEKKRSATSYDKMKFLLLILDGVPDTMKEDAILLDIKDALQLNEESSMYKVLITKRSNEPVKEASESTEMNEVTAETNKSIEIEPLTEKEGLTLLKKRVNEKVKKVAGFENFAGEIAKKSKGLPAAIVVIAEALNRIGEHDSKTLTLEGALKEAADDVNPLLPFAYGMLQMTDMVLINSCRQSRQLFLKHGGVHYHELIAFWILEGCVGAFDRVEEAYEEGYRILMELVDLHMLKIPYDNIVVMDGLALTVPVDCGEDGYGGSTTSNLGLASVLEGGDWQGFRRITQAGGMIKTPSNMDASPIEKRWEKVSTLLIDGRSLYREVPDKFFDPMHRLQVLVIFNPTFRSLPSSLSKMGELRLLVLRGCDPLENIDPIKGLKSLTVLEISGATSLKNIPDDDFFKNLTQLRSLNLSAAQIRSLPPSVSLLSELRWLILRGCSSFETLPKLKKLTNLQVLDLSGATKLKRFEDVTLKCLVNLQILDISETQLERLPILGSRENLTRLSLRCCESLPRSSMLKGLSNLQILDLSGADKLKEIPDESLQSKYGLKILNLSKTSISHLPFKFDKISSLELLDLSGACNLVKMEDKCFDNLSCLRHLDLSNTKFENLPSLSNLDKLEVLNLSGCSALTKIGDDQSFEHMTRLQCLNLSETKIECLPAPSKLNLRQLLLRKCISLKELPSLESLSKLEELDLCGALLLKGTKAEFLNDMNLLQLLNLSGTGLVLPSLSNLTNLTQLSLRGCSLSESKPNLGKHTKLEVLDLSETKITSLPSLGNPSSLRQLKLRDCSSLGKLPDLKLLIHLEVLDLWGTGIERFFPYEISELTNLKHLDLPDMKGIQELEWGRIKRVPEEVNWVQCGIFKHCQNGPCVSLSATELPTVLAHESELGGTCFSVYLLKEQRSGGDIFWHKVDPSLRNIYLKTLSVPEERGLFLEIVGWPEERDRFPGVKDGQVTPKYISLIDNKFIKSLSAGVKAMNVGVMAMKGCMVERCTEMDTIFGGEETEVKMMLETLWASNLPKLESVVSSGIVEFGGFQKLTRLYLDCCPVLRVVFASAQLPENLEILHIKFCEKLETLFSPDLETESKLWKLQKLHLLELPELTSIGVSKYISPSIQSIKVCECPKISEDEISALPGESVTNSKIEEYWGLTGISTDFR